MPTPSVHWLASSPFSPGHLPRSVKASRVLARCGLESLAVALAPSGPEPVRDLPLLQIHSRTMKISLRVRLAEARDDFMSLDSKILSKLLATRHSGGESLS
jgi:hypothetical protein